MSFEELRSLGSVLDIHPFVNANGRTGRLMSNFLLMWAGYEPVNIQAESRARYIAAIRAFQEGDDPYPFVAFFCLNLAEQLEKVLGLLDAGMRPDAEWRVSSIGDYLDSPGNADLRFACSNAFSGRVSGSSDENPVRLPRTLNRSENIPATRFFTADTGP